MNKLFTFFLIFLFVSSTFAQRQETKIRVIVTSDGEIDDECSMVRCLLYANEWDIEGIVTSSSQYHWQGHKWAGDDWMNPYLEAYEKVYPNLIKHDKGYPKPQYLRERTVLGNIKAEGEMDEVTAGSQLIVKELLDKSDPRPVWLQAWGGTNTIARALKTIEQNHPERMEEVAGKVRLFLIWEQDSTYQSYIRPHWGKYNILTVNSDQFEAIAYRWKNTQPKEMHRYFEGAWMKENILNDHGPLCSLYKAHGKEDKDFNEGDFRSEGDSPAFMHTIETGLRNLENPHWGGWGGRYIKVRENTWMDPVPEKGYVYPEGRWYGSNGWGRLSSKRGATAETDSNHNAYFKPIWRWSEAFQNDFAARADWCVKLFEEANHAPVVKVQGALDRKAASKDKIKLNAKGTKDPDDDRLSYRWWQYVEAGSYKGSIRISNASNKKASFIVPSDIKKGETLHIICEVRDNGSPQLTRYQRLVLTAE
jgi:hypothetical protein